MMTLYSTVAFADVPPIPDAPYKRYDEANYFRGHEMVPSHIPVVGTLEVRGARGTAFLIEESFILTNFHAAFGADMKHPSKSQTSIFTLPEVKDSGGKHPSSIATPVIWGNFTDDGTDDEVDQDWALLALQIPLGKTYDYIRPKPLPPDQVDQMRNQFALVGYGGQTIRQTIDPKCSLLSELRNPFPSGWGTDCQLEGGHSGSPIVYIENNTPWVVAIASGDLDGNEKGACENKAGKNGGELPSYSFECSNLVVPIYKIYDRVQATMKEYMRTHPQP